jgi:hypothetical protein
MHSGGGRKTAFEYIYIEGRREEAIATFITEFRQDPSDVACDCCGENFSVSEHETLEEASEFERGYEPNAPTRTIPKR